MRWERRAEGGSNGTPREWARRSSLIQTKNQVRNQVDCIDNACIVSC